jgi:hypothetical protein
MMFDDKRKSAKTQYPNRNCRQLQDLVVSPANYNVTAPNQRFFGSREAIVLTLGNTSPLFSEHAQPNSVKHQLDRDHDSILSPEYSQTSKAAPRRPARMPWPNEATRPSLIQASLETQASKHASKPRSRYGARGATELRLLTHSDKSLINEIQGYIQSKGRSPSIHHPQQSYN